MLDSGLGWGGCLVLSSNCVRSKMVTAAFLETPEQGPTHRSASSPPVPNQWKSDSGLNDQRGGGGGGGSH